MSSILDEVVYLILLFSSMAIFMKASAQPCIQWNDAQKVQVLGGRSDAEARTSADCQEICAELTSCVAVAWKESRPNCWIYTNPEDMDRASPADDNSVLYTIRSRPLICQNCTGTWIETKDANREGGHVLYSDSASECQGHCLREPTCKEIDFENPTKKCHLHQTARPSLSALLGKIGDINYVLTSRTCPEQVTPGSWTDGEETWFKIRHANRIMGHYLNADSLEVCKELCRRQPSCREIDWEPPTKKCHLHKTCRRNLTDLLYKFGDDYYMMTSRTCAGTIYRSTFGTSSSTTIKATELGDNTSLPTTSSGSTDQDSGIDHQYIVVISVMSVVVGVLMITVPVVCYVCCKRAKSRKNENPRKDDGYLEPTPIYYTLSDRTTSGQGGEYAVIENESYAQQGDWQY